MTWQPSPDGVLAFDRLSIGGGTSDAGLPGLNTSTGEPSATMRCVANLSAAPVPLPPHTGILLASGPIDDGLLPPDTTVWLRIG